MTKSKRLPVYVIGHRNPDTDSICSAIAYAAFKEKTGESNVIPARCGEINRETKFVLDYFNVPVPKLVKDLYLRVGHIMTTDVDYIHPEQPLLEAGKGFYEKKTNFFPVVSDDFSLVGVISTTDIAKRYIQEMAITSFSEISTTLDNLLFCLSGTLLVGTSNKQKIKGNVVVCAMAIDTLGRYVKKKIPSS